MTDHVRRDPGADDRNRDRPEAAQASLRWRYSAATISRTDADTGLSAAEDDPADIALWTRGYEAVLDVRHGDAFHVTRWAAAGTLRSVDHSSGYEVVDVDGKILRHYIEVSDPLLGFRRAVRRHRLRPVRAERRAAVYMLDGMAIELGPYGLPTRVTADGITRTFHIRCYGVFCWGLVSRL